MMDSKILLLASYMPLLLFLQLLQTCSGENNSLCPPSSCGKIHNISYPFRLENDPLHCGIRNYTLHCERNITVLYLNAGKYYVQAINYNNFTIRVVDPGISANNCSSIPLFTLTNYELGTEDPYTWHRFNSNSLSLSENVIFISCSRKANSSLYVETTSCNYYNLIRQKYSYVNIGGMILSDLMNGCTLESMTMLPAKNYENTSFVEIHRDLVYGFELSWHTIYCGRCRGCSFQRTDKPQCISYERWVTYYNFRKKYAYLDVSDAYALFYGIARSLPTVLVLLVLCHFVIKPVCGTPLVLGFLIYKWRRRHLSGYDGVEEFLENHNNLMPIRYSYSDIRKMTEGFKEKLGEGGFGSVYKAKLRSGRVAAVKILGKSKTDGQDFINEVATIGRIHHTNVVQLIGFCVEGSKHALIYDFMPNGSLDKYVFSREKSTPISWEKLLEISIGVAQGIEYLHRGCDMQILHFDIKPHNILLDENFIPKISDFGLAKSYETNNTIKSLTAARGTIGYMAPELFYRNIGNVSYKADIYSYGMLLLEMAGKRKKLNELVENSSETYYPYWVYDENIIAITDGNEEENRVAKKMVVVGLWCIQMNPSNRPPMNQVIEMLEADLENLQLPPKPLLYPREKLTGESAQLSSIADDFTDVTESSSLIEHTY